jgi:hypothetical protein
MSSDSERIEHLQYEQNAKKVIHGLLTSNFCCGFFVSRFNSRLPGASRTSYPFNSCGDVKVVVRLKQRISHILHEICAAGITQLLNGLKVTHRL